MANSTSLDDLLRDMEGKNAEAASELPAAPQSAGLKDIASHEVTIPTGSSSPFLMPDDGGVPQLTRELMGNRTDISERLVSSSANPLTARQRHLPRLSYRMMGSLVAVLVLMVGLGSAVYLSQQTQDVRQRAYEGGTGTSALVSPVPIHSALPGSSITSSPSPGAVVSSPTVISSPVPQQNSTTWWQNPIMIAGAAILIASAILLTVFFHWLFDL